MGFWIYVLGAAASIILSVAVSSGESVWAFRSERLLPAVLIANGFLFGALLLREDSSESRLSVRIRAVSTAILSAVALPLAIMLLLSTAIRSGEPIWEFRVGFLLPTALIFNGLLFSALLLWERETKRSSRSVISPLLMVSVSGAGLPLLLMGLIGDVSRVTATACAALAIFFLLTLAFLPYAWIKHAASALLLFILVIANATLAYRDLERNLDPTATREVGSQGASQGGLFSNLYNFSVSRYGNGLLDGIAGGGGFTPIDPASPEYVLANGDGKVFLVGRPPTDQELQIVPLDIRVPINADAFANDVGERANVSWFRTFDVLATRIEEGIQLLASHHYWYSEEECFVVRLSEIVLEGLDSDISSVSREWNTRYESSPCLPLGSPYSELVFAGNEGGGRLTRLNGEKILLTIGHHEFDGVNAEDLVQDPQASYGKIIEIDSVTWESGTYSTGHRNPQGLFVDLDGNVWSTEHGPQGGDELNQIVRGQNYGWPLVTYGVQYGLPSWPLSVTPDEHTGFAPPLFAWIPSIGASNLIRLQGEAFLRWRGDLLVGSLSGANSALTDRPAGHSLYRIRVREGRVIYAEKIYLGEEVRDLSEIPGGGLLIWTGAELLVLDPAPSKTSGWLVFAKCRGCHAVGGGATHGIGPDLKGVLERPVASALGFGYSSALQSYGGTWTRDRLSQFLTDPQGSVPGTRMQISSEISSSEELEALLDYIEQSTR